MINWIIGESNTGKTTLANKIQEYHKNTIVLDSDELRGILKNFDYDSYLQNLALLSKMLSEQGFDVAVCAIIENEKIKARIEKICNPEWIEL